MCTQPHEAVARIHDKQDWPQGNAQDARDGEEISGTARRPRTDSTADGLLR